MYSYMAQIWTKANYSGSGNRQVMTIQSMKEFLEAFAIMAKNYFFVDDREKSSFETYFHGLYRLYEKISPQIEKIKTRKEVEKLIEELLNKEVLLELSPARQERLARRSEFFIKNFTPHYDYYRVIAGVLKLCLPLTSEDDREPLRKISRYLIEKRGGTFLQMVNWVGEFA